LKIALSGYGKMGHEVEKAAVARGHGILIAIDTPDGWNSAVKLLESCDAVIDFSTPAAAAMAVNRCFDLGIPVVSGTTGWADGLSAAIQRCLSGNHSFFHAPNFSIGVNIFFEINRHLAQLMNPYSTNRAAIHEIHHIYKKDAPSGTAIALADGILEANQAYHRWVSGPSANPGELEVSSERTGEIPGTHIVSWSSATDDIEIKHTARNREGFALGAVLAAEWLRGRKGFFGMADLLGNKP
jgi:4-hydroxy-tetrahydrodipicolinate reductase